MSFELPADDDPFLKRIYIMVRLLGELYIEMILPCIATVVVLGGIALVCGKLLGLDVLNFIRDTIIHMNKLNEQTFKKFRVDSAKSVKALDEKTRANIEMEILEEMLEARRVRAEKLAKREITAK